MASFSRPIISSSSTSISSSSTATIKSPQPTSRRMPQFNTFKSRARTSSLGSYGQPTLNFVKAAFSARSKQSFTPAPAPTRLSKSPASSVFSLSDRSTSELSGQSSTTSLEDHPEDMKEGQGFIAKPTRSRNGSKVHPYTRSEVAYPLSYDPTVLHSERHNHDLFKAINQNTMFFVNLENRPTPQAILDLGCGQGWWVMEAAVYFKKAYVVGYDLMDLQPSPETMSSQYGLQEDQISRIQWIHGNFLVEQLPFQDAQFDVVRMADLGLAIPCEKWAFILEEVHRILKPGGFVEIIDDDLLIPQSPYSPSTPTLDAAIKFSFENTLRGLGHSMNLYHDPQLTDKRYPKNRERWLPGLMAIYFRDSELGKYSLGIASRGGRAEKRRSNQLDPDSDCEDRLPVQSKKLGKVFGVADSELPKAQTGLILYPDTLLHMTPDQVEAHATRNMQTLLASKEAMWIDCLEREKVLRRLPEHQEPALRKAFERMIWEFEYSSLPRVDLPIRPIMDDDDCSPNGSWPTCSTPTSPVFHNLNKINSPVKRSSYKPLPRLPRLDGSSEKELTTVRRLSVWYGRKAPYSSSTFL